MAGLQSCLSQRRHRSTQEGPGQDTTAASKEHRTIHRYRRVSFLRSLHARSIYVRYCAGAMLLLKSGRCAVVEKGSLFSLMFLSMEGARVLMRREARMAVQAIKRAIAISRTREVKREVARVGGGVV